MLRHLNYHTHTHTRARVCVIMCHTTRVGPNGGALVCGALACLPLDTVRGGHVLCGEIVFAARVPYPTLRGRGQQLLLSGFVGICS